ncbi:MAG TPA: YdcF family protein [Pyrinomonadaceae bacterium]|nr:YdcF family protein [Pyrinomonadaceae bacterium]
MTRLLRAIRRRWWILVLVCAAWVLGAWFAASSLIVSRPLEHADAIVVLSGSGTFTERTNKAAQLYRAGVARTIIITNDNRQGGWSKVEQRNPYYYERAIAELLMEGVSAADIVVLPDVVHSTHDEVVALRKHAQAVPLKSMVIVTSAYHSRRALNAMQKSFAGTDVKIGVDPVPPGHQTPKSATWWLHPQGWEDVALEYVKIVYYVCRY